MGMQRCSPANTLLAAVLALTVLGCGDPSRPVKVEGVVTLDGKPVEGATVSFLPQDNKGRQAAGVTDRNGVFRLTTRNTDDGAQPGAYKVVVTKSPPATTEADAAAIEQGGVEAAMKVYQKVITARPARQAAKKGELLPARYGSEAATPLRCTVPTDGRVILELQSRGG